MSKASEFVDYESVEYHLREVVKAPHYVLVKADWGTLMRLSHLAEVAAQKLEAAREDRASRDLESDQKDWTTNWCPPGGHGSAF